MHEPHNEIKPKTVKECWIGACMDGNPQMVDVQDVGRLFDLDVSGQIEQPLLRMNSSAKKKESHVHHVTLFW